jgi:hypothetical protein
MTPEGQVAYVISQSVCAMIEAMGMHAANERAKRSGIILVGLPYGQKDFDELISRYGIHHNAVVSGLNPY